MTKWLLKVQVCGEWEECAFQSRQEALTAFVALAADYTAKIERAVLLRDTNLPIIKFSPKGYIN